MADRISPIEPIGGLEQIERVQPVGRKESQSLLKRSRSLLFYFRSTAPSIFVKIFSCISSWDIVVITRPWGTLMMKARVASKARILVAPLALARPRQSGGP